MATLGASQTYMKPMVLACFGLTVHAGQVKTEVKRMVFSPKPTENHLKPRPFLGPAAPLLGVWQCGVWL